MDRVFTCLDETFNKSARNQFVKFLKKYKDVPKWFMCSDYCIGDKNKANDVISFVLFPYIYDFNEWNEMITKLQKTDLKHCRHISESFCRYVKEGNFFSFNFILEKNNILYKWEDKASLDNLLKSYVELTEQWQITTPSNAENYKRINKKLKTLQNDSKQKSFNYSMFGRVIYICFLAGYLRYLLLKEKDDIEMFSWLSDRDAITDWKNEVYIEFYHIISHCICENKLVQGKEKTVKDVYLEDVQNNMFYDGFNRIADFICGALADFNYKNGSVTGEKQCTLLEDVISDNDFLIILDINDHEISRIIHNKMI